MKRYILLVCAMLMLAGYTTYAGPPISGGGGGSGDFKADGTVPMTGDLAMGTNDITGVGSIGATGAGKVTKGWFTDLELTNAPTVGGAAFVPATASALAADPADCAAGEYATGIAASGALSCTGTISALAVTATGGNLNVGVSDTIRGLFRAYGPATPGAEGGTLILDTGADHDGTINEYGIEVYEDDLYIGPDTNIDFIKITAGTALGVDGVVTATGFSGPLNGTVGATTPAAGTFTSVSVVRADTPQTLTLYEATSDGDHVGTITAPAKGTGYTGDRVITMPDATGTVALVQTQKLATFSYSGGGSAIAADTKLDAYIPAASTITGWVMLSTTSCSMVVDIWSQAYADFPPEVAQTIIQSEPPTLTTAAMGQDLSLAATWTEALAANVTLRANVTSSDCIGNVSVTLIGTIP